MNSTGITSTRVLLTVLGPQSYPSIILSECLTELKYLPRLGVRYLNSAQGPGKYHVGLEYVLGRR